MRRSGGFDCKFLGIGQTGHIGSKERGSTHPSRTRLATLDPVTRRDAAGSFYGEENVPHQALTMGVGTILDARKIVLLVALAVSYARNSAACFVNHSRILWLVQVQVNGWA